MCSNTFSLRIDNVFVDLSCCRIVYHKELKSNSWSWEGGEGEGGGILRLRTRLKVWRRWHWLALPRLDEAKIELLYELRRQMPARDWREEREREVCDLMTDGRPALALSAFAFAFALTSRCDGAPCSLLAKTMLWKCISEILESNSGNANFF